MQALLLAQEAHDAAAIRKSTIAVIFMGTPHRGSQLASYADLAVTCIKATGIKANTANLRHLKLDSDDLEELGTQFGSLLQSESIKVLTFYELKPTRIAGIGETMVRQMISYKLYFSRLKFLFAGCTKMVREAWPRSPSRNCHSS